MPANITSSQLGQVEAKNIVEDIFRDKYGDDGFVTHKISGSPHVKAKGFQDTVKIQPLESGVEFVLNEASESTASQIRSRVDNGRGQAQSIVEVPEGQETSTGGVTAEGCGEIMEEIMSESDTVLDGYRAGRTIEIEGTRDDHSNLVDIAVETDCITPNEAERIKGVYENLLRAVEMERPTPQVSDSKNDHQEIVADAFNSGPEMTFDDTQQTNQGIGPGEVIAFDDNSIRFVPPFTKTQANYLEPNDPNFDASHKRCHSCAHFIEGGGCHVVEGSIDPEGYCDEFYADVGTFAHKHNEGAEINLILWGESFDWDMETVENFVLEVKERLQSRVRNMIG